MDLYIDSNGILKAGDKYLPKAKFHFKVIDSTSISIIDVVSLNIAIGAREATAFNKEDGSPYTDLAEVLLALNSFFIPA